jgi:hypothetical protein
MEIEQQAAGAAETTVTEAAPASGGTEQPAVADPVAAMQERLLNSLSMLTLGLAQQREQLAQREREAANLAAEITQRKARIEADSEELLRVRGAVTALQQLQEGK